jgi:hypothetical protein
MVEKARDRSQVLGKKPDINAFGEVSYRAAIGTWLKVAPNKPMWYWRRVLGTYSVYRSYNSRCR